MCMMPGRGHGHGHGMMGHGCCCGPGGFMGWRRFITPAEEMEGLVNYKEQLQKELAGVEARLKELKGKK